MLIQGDIHDIIKTISTNSIDLIYTNPPFGITNKKWDKTIKGLTKKAVAKVSKTNEGLFVEVI